MSAARELPEFSPRLYGVFVRYLRYYFARNFDAVRLSRTGRLPRPLEGPLVVYTNHTSTDQVAGFGGSAKRSIGRKFMAAQLEKSFERSKQMVEK